MGLPSWAHPHNSLNTLEIGFGIRAVSWWPAVFMAKVPIVRTMVVGLEVEKRKIRSVSRNLKE